MGVSPFSQVILGNSLRQRRFRLASGKKGLSAIGMGCPGKWSDHPWKCSITWIWEFSAMASLRWCSGKSWTVLEGFSNHRDWESDSVTSANWFSGPFSSVNRRSYDTNLDTLLPVGKSVWRENLSKQVHQHSNLHNLTSPVQSHCCNYCALNMAVFRQVSNYFSVMWA